MGGTVVELRRYRNIVFDSSRWAGFEFRDGDIVISTPAKCGTTWTQMLCALLIFGTADLPRPLAELSPWLDMQLARRDDVVALLESQEHRRFIKTHTPLDGVPYDERVTYICVARDPRDVAASWAHHLSNMNVDRFFEVRAGAVGLDDLGDLGLTPDAPPPPAAGSPEQVAHWIDAPLDSPVMTLSILLHHVRTFWDRRDDPAVELFHYADYAVDLPGQMRRLADALGIDCSPDDIEALATAASFGSMKERAHQVAPNSDLAIWRDTSEFFHRGSSGQWQELFGPEHLRRYDERIAELDDQALVSWIHGGWGAVASASDVTYPPAPRTAATDPAPPSAGAARHR